MQTRRFGHLDVSTEHLFEILGEADLVEGGSGRVEVHEQVDIAPATDRAPRHGPEHAGVTGVILPECLRYLFPEGIDQLRNSELSPASDFCQKWHIPESRLAPGTPDRFVGAGPPDEKNTGSSRRAPRGR